MRVLRLKMTSLRAVETKRPLNSRNLRISKMVTLNLLLNCHLQTTSILKNDYCVLNIIKID